MNFQEVYQGSQPAPWVRDLTGKSGCYLVKEKGILGSVIYIGESHTGRLKKTLLRHFQHWKGKTSGPTFTKRGYVVAVVRTRPEIAKSTQDALIDEYRPALNTAGKGAWWE